MITFLLMSLLLGLPFTLVFIAVGLTLSFIAFIIFFAYDIYDTIKYGLPVDLDGK